MFPSASLYQHQQVFPSASLYQCEHQQVFPSLSLYKLGVTWLDLRRAQSGALSLDALPTPAGVGARGIWQDV